MTRICPVIRLEGKDLRAPRRCHVSDSDNLLFDLNHVALGGNFVLPSSFFRDRSQLSARVGAHN